MPLETREFLLVRWGASSCEGTSYVSSLITQAGVDLL